MIEMNERMHEWMNECMNERMHEWLAWLYGMHETTWNENGMQRKAMQCKEKWN